MTATQKLEAAIAAHPVLTSYAFFYRALGLTDAQIVAKFSLD